MAGTKDWPSVKTFISLKQKFYLFFKSKFLNVSLSLPAIIPSQSQSHTRSFHRSSPVPASVSAGLSLIKFYFPCFHTKLPTIPSVNRKIKILLSTAVVMNREDPRRKEFAAVRALCLGFAVTKEDRFRILSINCFIFMLFQRQTHRWVC